MQHFIYDARREITRCGLCVVLCCGVVWCGVVWCDAMWCDMVQWVLWCVRCDAMRCGAVRCGMVVLAHKVLYGVTCITMCEGNSHKFPRFFLRFEHPGISAHGCSKFQGHAAGRRIRGESQRAGLHVGAQTGSAPPGNITLVLVNIELAAGSV